MHCVVAELALQLPAALLAANESAGLATELAALCWLCSCLMQRFPLVHQCMQEADDFRLALQQGRHYLTGNFHGA